jgi:hypothetical protein
MSHATHQKLPVYIALVALGSSLNALGIVFQNIGWPRFALMGAGVLMMLVGVVKLVSTRAGADSPPE